MDNFGKLIRDRRTELNLSLRDIADRIGSTASTVAKWERGEVANVKRDKVVALAHALNLHPAILFGYSQADIKALAKSDAIEMVKLPVYGNGIKFFEAANIQRFISTEKIGDYFAFETLNSITQQNICAGDVLLCNRQFQLTNGIIILCLINKSILIKEVITNGQYITLTSDNTPPLIYPADGFNIMVFGQVREIRKEVL